jgi:dTDP-4-amino-4,6-dideoxygalactose transaminase
MANEHAGPVPFFRHGLGAVELAAVGEVFEGEFLTAGPRAAAFERAMAEHLGVAHALGTGGCTAALHLCLRAMGVGPGDEVILPAMTYVATMSAVLHAGAAPVFVDVDADTGLMDPDAAAAALTPRTRALLPVHLYGQLADMPRLRALADAHGLALLEDAAHCIEGRRDGLRPAGLGDAACFSFYATKNISAGEGGLIATRSPELLARLTRLRNHGIDRDASSRHGGAFSHWDQVEAGHRTTLTDIQAAMLQPQLARIEALRETRQRLARAYDEAFSEVADVRPLPRTPGVVSAHHLYPVQVPAARRDALLAFLRDQGVGVGVHYRAVHLLRYPRERFGTQRGQLPRAEAIGDATLSIPLFPGLRHEEQAAVIQRVKEGLLHA